MGRQQTHIRKKMFSDSVQDKSLGVLLGLLGSSSLSSELDDSVNEPAFGIGAMPTKRGDDSGSSL
jgi:hypothetical protein